MAIRFVTSTSTSATFEWDAVADAERYLFRLNIANVVIGQYLGPRRMATIGRLRIGQSYSVLLWSVANNRYTIQPGISYTHAAAPAAPVGLHTTAITHNSVTLAWSPVTGATGYQARVSTDSQWIDVGSAIEYTITGLAPDRMYRLEVRAQNARGYGDESSIDVRTTSAPATPPGELPMQTPGSAQALRYEIVLADDRTLDVSRRVLEFRFDYGADITDVVTPPLWMKSSGLVRINNYDNAYGQGDVVGWERLNVYAAKTQIFALVVYERDISDEVSRINLSVEGLAAHRLREKTPVQVNTGLSDLSIAAYLTESGFPFGRFTGVTLPGMFVAAGAAYDALQSGVPAYRKIEPRFTTDVSSYIDHVSAFATLLPLEDPLVDRWNLYPVPPSGDSRAAAATISSENDLIRADYRFEDLTYWQRDAWILETLNAATKIVTGSVDTRGSSGAPGNKTINGVRYNSVLRFKLSASTRIVKIRKISGINFTRASDGGHFNGTVRYLGSIGSTVYIRTTGVNSSWRMRFRYELVVETFATERDLPIFADDVTESELGYLSTSTIPIPRHGNNYTPSLTAARALLNRWASWQPQTAFITILLTGNFSHILIKPGEIVNVTVGENIDHRALIARVRVYHAGLKPIQLAWDLLLIGPIAQAGESPPDPRRVEWSGQPIEFFGENVYHGGRA